ncbi:hypothetical protein O9992_01165 [Vibrio lentus]|nr:hypothetical protein [Vibrio lentus]
MTCTSKDTKALEDALLTFALPIYAVDADGDRSALFEVQHTRSC